MSEAVDAVRAPGPEGPITPGADATDVGRPSFGQTLLAPFLFGLAVGYVWLLIGDAVAINLLAMGYQALSAVPPALLLALAAGALFVLPGAAAVASTVGDGHFWGAGSVARRVSASVRLALALALALVVGNLTWVVSYLATPGQRPGAQRFDILDRVVVLGNLAMVEWAFLIGTLAAFTFGRWPVRTRRLAPLAQVGRWLAVGALAAAGLLFFDDTLRLATLVAIGALLRPAGAACSGGPCPNIMLREVMQLGQQLGGALVGGVLGGVLRAGLVGMWRLRGVGDEGQGQGQDRAQVVAPERRQSQARTWSPLGLGLLCGAAWIGGLFAALVTLPRSIEEAAALLALLGAVVPLGIAVAAVMAQRRRAVRDATEGQRVGKSATIALVLVGVLAGVVPAYLLARRLTTLSDALFLIQMIPVVTPGFSAGVALGYAFGARAGDEVAMAQGWWRAGTRAALWGGVGFGLSFLGLLLTQFVLQASQPVQCHGLGGCVLGTLIHVQFTSELMVASITTVAMVVLGGVVGAALRAGVVGRRRAG